MILGPVMLELGLHPLVTASTSLLLVGASSSSATVGFALADRLDYGWAIIMFVLCVVASTVGVAGIGKIVRRSGKASLIVFLLVFIMFAGGLLTAVSPPLLPSILRDVPKQNIQLRDALLWINCHVYYLVEHAQKQGWLILAMPNVDANYSGACRFLEAYMLSATFMKDTEPGF